MEVKELIEQMRRANPDLLDGIPEDKAEALVRNVFKHINETLAGTADGVVQYAGLGRFRVRKVERDKAGEKTVRTRIGFRVLEPGQGKGGRKGRREGAGGDAGRPRALKGGKGRRDRAGGAGRERPGGAARGGKGRRNRAGNDDV